MIKAAELASVFETEIDHPLGLLKVKVGNLTLPFPSLLVPTPFTKGGRAEPPSTISKTVTPMNLKFCRILETPLKVLEMLKLFT